jgi:hypothetical protein
MGAGISVANFAELDENTKQLVKKQCIELRYDNDPCQCLFDYGKDNNVYEKWRSQLGYGNQSNTNTNTKIVTK